MIRVKKEIAVIILAAGQGTRMKSNKAKVLHSVAGKPMIEYVVETAGKIAGDEVIVVIGHQAEKVRQTVLKTAKVKFAVQDQRKGTGHAVWCALPQVSKQAELVVILCGDVPLLRWETIRTLVDDHQNAGRDLTFLAVDKDPPHGYGRVIMDENRRVSAIVEEADATPDQKKITTINAGVYCINKKLLEDSLPKIQAKNVQGEMYLTDIVEIACGAGKTVGVLIGSDEAQLAGINTLVDLKALENIVHTEQFKTT